jgi:hypothetical protein
MGLERRAELRRNMITSPGPTRSIPSTSPRGHSSYHTCHSLFLTLAPLNFAGTATQKSNMPSSACVAGPSETGPSERTPLLEPATSQHQGAINNEDVQAAQEVGEGGLEVPQFPELNKTISSAEAEHVVRFQKNGLLEGVPTWRFRCIFGGIVMGYFVGWNASHKGSANTS